MKEPIRRNEDEKANSRQEKADRHHSAVGGIVRSAGPDRIHMDEIGMAWIIDRENGFIWHNGGTGHYNSYLGFCPETGTSVVVLSNLPPNDRIPATVLGIKSCRN